MMRRAHPTNGASRHTSSFATCPLTTRTHLAGLHVGRPCKNAFSGHLPMHTSWGGQPTPRQRGQRVVARTSEHWWEDEEEFDGVAGEVILPKTLHIISLPTRSCMGADEGSKASSTESSSTAQATAQATAVKPDAATLRRTVNAGCKLIKSGLIGSPMTAGFCSPSCAEVSRALWDEIGAGGPPYFRKVRTRDSMGLAKDASKSAVDAVLQELLSQNWRVELDYGLQGADLTPREHILMIMSSDEVQPLLDALLAEQEVGYSPGLWNDVAIVQVDLLGWNTDSKGTPAEELPPLQTWRDLRPSTLSICSTSL